MPSVSPLGPGTPTEGLQLLIGNAASPEVFAEVPNACDLKLPCKNETTDVTNFGDGFRRRIATLSDMGDITFKLYWMPTDTSMSNTTGGLRYIYVNKLSRDFKVIYNDGFNSEDVFPAYITGFEVTAQIGKVLEASITLSNSGPPTLC
jgi:hypothetical protein